jgi:hypothetical protein
LHAKVLWGREEEQTMAMVMAGLMIAGAVTLLVGAIMMIVAAFKVSVGWGIGVLLLAPVGLVFLFMHWQQCKKSFFIQLAGCVVMIVAAVLGGATPTQ